LGPHFEYLWHVFIILSPYCQEQLKKNFFFCNSSSPTTVGLAIHDLVGPSREDFVAAPGNSMNYSLAFTTICLQYFTELYSLFYLNGIKIVPADIYNLLTPVALAHWIMGYGEARNYGLIRMH